MQNNKLEDILVDLKNIYFMCKSRKDKRLVKDLIIKVEKWLENER